MVDAIALEHVLTLAPKEAEGVCRRAGGSSGQGELIESLAKTPLAVAELNSAPAHGSIPPTLVDTRGRTTRSGMAALRTATSTPSAGSCRS